MINSSLVKELRHMTSAPLMECKKALEETNGNLEEAKNFLRKKGQLLASKKSSREANEGVVAIHFDEAKTGAKKPDSKTITPGMVKLFRNGFCSSAYESVPRSYSFSLLNG